MLTLANPKSSRLAEGMQACNDRLQCTVWKCSKTDGETRNFKPDEVYLAQSGGRRSLRNCFQTESYVRHGQSGQRLDQTTTTCYDDKKMHMHTVVVLMEVMLMIVRVQVQWSASATGRTDRRKDHRKHTQHNS